MKYVIKARDRRSRGRDLRAHFAEDDVRRQGDRGGRCRVRLRQRERRWARAHLPWHRYRRTRRGEEGRRRAADAAREHRRQTHGAREAAALSQSSSNPSSTGTTAAPETELNFRFYRQATNKIGGVSDRAVAFLETFFGPVRRR